MLRLGGRRVLEAPTGDYREQNESEIVVSIFRTLVLLLVVLVPRFSSVTTGTSPPPTPPGEPIPPLSSDAYALIIFAAVYNLLTTLTYLRQIDLPFRRQTMVVMDLCLVTLWISINPGEKSGLFALYYLITIVAAIWFKVFGSVITASLACVLYILTYVTGSPDPWTAFQAFILSLSLPVPFLYLVALLSGYLAEAQEMERTRRVETQLLVSDYERELSMSRDIQKLLLPGHLPRIPGVDLAARSRVARVVGGGDYYDLILLGGSRFGLCIADVAGKSIHAQIRLPLLKYALRAVAPMHDSPDAVVHHLNEMVYEDLQPDMFIAICYGIFDPLNNTVKMCIAGHAPPIRFSSEENSCVCLPAGGVPLGVEKSVRSDVLQMLWGERDVFVLHTDGVDHARNALGEEFGEERLMRLLLDGLALPASSLAEKILRTVDEYEYGERGDDLTILVVKREIDQ